MGIHPPRRPGNHDNGFHSNRFPLANVHHIPKQKFGIKTAGLEDKCTAMQMLVVYAKDLKEGFAEYADSVGVACHAHFFT